MGSVAAVTETGSLVVASASGAQLPGYAGGAGHAIWIVGAQKVVPDLSTALRRIEAHCLPLESARAQAGLRPAQCRQPRAHPQRGTRARPRHRPAAPRTHRILTNSHRPVPPRTAKRVGIGAPTRSTLRPRRVGPRHGTLHAALMRNAEFMTDFHPLPEPRKTLTHANCVVSTPLGYRPLHLDLHVPPGDGPFPVVLWIHGGGLDDRQSGVDRGPAVP